MDEMIDRLVFTSKEGYVYIAEFDRHARGVRLGGLFRVTEIFRATEYLLNI
jgi:hypothetical protein